MTGLPSPRPAITGDQRNAIDRCFSPSNRTIGEVLGALQSVRERNEGGELGTWAKKTADTIYQRSPTSVLVALRQMRVGREWNIAQAFQHEYNIAARFMRHPDFVEGVTARLIERRKERPAWAPGTLDEIDEKEVDGFFEQPPQLRLLEAGDRSAYREYPHAWLGLPREEEVVALNVGGELQGEEIVQHFLRAKEGKVGVREKVEEILERRKR